MSSIINPQVTDVTIWREVGDPLLVGSGTGPLAGETVAVKDVYAVVGSRRGAGNPTWLAQTTMQTSTAPVLATLLEAGAVVRGIAQTDELAYSLAGTNPHYGAPLNATSPGRVPGGSSSGSASAVALGHASIGLGTDTAGSIRVPAAYQGLFGIRTTHGLLPRDGVLPLAPSFDTVGWLTRDADLLRRVGDVLLPPAEGPGGSGGADLVVVPELVDLADDDVAETVLAWAEAAGAEREDWPLDELGTWRSAFPVWQGWEAWAAHGEWITAHPDALGPDVAARFATASQVGAAAAEHARGVLHEARGRIRELVGDRVLLLPSAPSVAPALGDDLPARLQEARDATLRLTCLAGIAGLPAVSVPLRTAAGVPAGGCLVAATGRDRDLLDLAGRLALPV